MLFCGERRSRFAGRGLFPNEVGVHLENNLGCIQMLLSVPWKLSHLREADVRTPLFREHNAGIRVGRLA